MTNEEAKVFGKMWLDMNEDAKNKLQRGLALTVKESWDLYKYIEALKQQPCEDCISRAYIEPIVEELENICINGDEHMLSLLSDIKNAPSVTPQPKVGKWILKHRKHNSMKWLTGTDEYGVEHTVKKYEEYECDEPYCSKCGKLAGDTSQNYCPNCGSYNGGEKEC